MPNEVAIAAPKRNNNPAAQRATQRRPESKHQCDAEKQFRDCGGPSDKRDDECRQKRVNLSRILLEIRKITPSALLTPKAKAIRHC